MARNDHRQATMRIIGKHVIDKFKDLNTTYRSTNLMNDIHHDFGIQMSYQKARKCREAALELIRGLPEDSYTSLPAYLHSLALANPDIVYYLELDDDNHFKYLFLAFGPCIRGFHSSMRPVLVVDGTFLIAKYRGDKEDLIVISDRHKSFINAVQDVYNNAHHGHCIYHIKGNLRTVTRNANTVSLFMKAAEPYTNEEFGIFMDQIRSNDETGWRYLNGTNFQTWAMSHFQGNRYNIMTSNNAESLNSLFKKERQGTILPLIEGIGNKLQKWFFERCQNAQNCTSCLTPTMEQKMRKQYDIAKRFTAQPIDQLIYAVRGGNTMNYIVNFAENTSTCRKFQLDHFPCEHAIATAKQRQFSAYNLCSHYYTIDFWKAAYACSIIPAPNKTEWQVPIDESSPSSSCLSHAIPH